MIVDLSTHEDKLYSQNGEDGITLKILETIGVTNCYYVEFGAHHHECNSRVLREKYGWKGLCMDGDPSQHNPSISFYQEFVTPSNINDLYKKYGVVDNPDFMSIDVDGNDFHIWNHIDRRYDPRMMITEINSYHDWNEDKVIPYSENFNWPETGYTHWFGASLMAMNNLAESRGYKLVYVDFMGVNAFFVKQSEIPSDVEFLNMGNVEKLYNVPKYGNGPKGGHWADPHNRPFEPSSKYINLTV